MTKTTERLAMFDALEIAARPEAGKTEKNLPDEFLLVRFGKNNFTKDGKRGDFEFSEKDADTVINEFVARGKDLVIDYEHQTLKGGQAPAAGWVEKLVKTKDGLVAKVKYWTEKASEYLRQSEYRYTSPVLQFSRRNKTVCALHSVAITNHPALHCNPALVADDTAADEELDLNKNNKTKEKENMNELLTMLGLVSLADSSDEGQLKGIEAEVKKLAESKSETQEFLKLHDCSSLDELAGKIQSMIPVEEKQKLESAIRKRDAETAVSKAFSDRKLMESSRKWAVSFAEKDLEGFTEWAQGAPAILPDNNGIDQKKEDGSSNSAFSDKEKNILRNLGLSESQIKSAKKENE